MRLRNQLAAALVIAMSALAATSLSARQTVPAHRTEVQLVKVGAYPTQVVATVRSVKRVRISTEKLGTDTVCVLKLRIHTTKALTGQGTTILDNESVEVVATEPVDASLVGKTVKAQLEMRADNDREQWLLTEVDVRQ